MKKFLLTFVLISFFFNSNAQTEKGNWIVSASSNFGTYSIGSAGQGEKTSNFNFHSGAGYFLADNFVLGLNLGASRTKYRKSANSSISLGLFARYYPQGEFFLGIDATSNLFFDEDSYKEDIVTFEIGYPIWLTDNIALEPSLYHGFINKYSDTRFTGMAMGFSLYF